MTFITLGTSETSPLLERQFTGSSSSGDAPELSVRTHFVPKGGKENRFLLELLSKEILDGAFRLNPALCLPPMPGMEELQLAIVDEFLESELTATILFQDQMWQTSFKIWEILLHLYDTCPHRVESIEIIGGFLRRLITCSKEYSQVACKALLGDAAAQSFSRETDLFDLQDVDIRFRCRHASEPELCSFTQAVVGFLSQKFGGLQELFVQKMAFTKFNKVKSGKTLFTIASFGKFFLKGISTAFVELECVFARQFEREHLFLHDAFRVNLLPCLLSKRAPSPMLRAPLAFESEISNGWQSFIDVHGRVIHIDNPATVDIAGIPRLFSLISQGYFLGDERVIDRSGGLPALADPFEVILTTFLTLQKNRYETLDAQIADQIIRCAQNHHRGRKEAAALIMFHLAEHLKDRVPAESIHRVWDILDLKYGFSSPAAKDNLPLMIWQAWVSQKIPHQTIIAAIQLACFFLLSKVSVEEDDPVICFKKHRGRPCLQLKFGEGIDDFLQVPFSPLDALEELERFSHRLSDGSEEILPLSKIFCSIANLPCGLRDGESALSTHREFFDRTYGRMADWAEERIESKAPFVSLIAYFLQLSFAAIDGLKCDPAALIKKFPQCLFSKDLPVGRERLFDHLAGAISRSPFAFFGAKIDALGKEAVSSKQGVFFKNWVISLAESQDPHLCRAAVELWEKHGEKYPKVNRWKVCCRLIEALIPQGLQQAERLLIKLQEERPQGFSPAEEARLIGKMLSCLKGQLGCQEAIANPARMVRILENLLLNIPDLSQNTSLQETSFESGAAWFIGHLFGKGSFDEGGELLSHLFRTKLIGENPGRSLATRHLDHLIHIKADDQTLKNVSRTYRSALSQDDLFKYGAELLVRALNSGSLQRAFNLWNRLCSFFSERDPPDLLIRLTEEFMARLVKEEDGPRALQCLAKILSNSLMPTLAPSFQNELLAYVNPILCQNMASVKGGQTDVEDIFASALMMEYLPKKKRGTSLQFAFILHLSEYLTICLENSAPIGNPLRKSLERRIQYLADDLLGSGEFRHALRCIVLLANHQIEAVIGRKTATGCLLALKSAGDSSDLSTETLSLYESFLAVLRKGAPIRAKYSHSAYAMACDAIFALHLRAERTDGAREFFRAQIEQDNGEFTRPDYYSWCDRLIESDLHAGLALLESLLLKFPDLEPRDEFFEKAISLLSLQAPNPRLDLLLCHSALFKRAKRVKPLEEQVKGCVSQVLAADCPLERCAACFDAMKRYCIEDPVFLTAMLKQASASGEPPVADLMWDLFRRAAVDGKAFSDFHAELRECWALMIRSLANSKHPVLLDIVKHSKSPDFPIRRAFASSGNKGQNFRFWASLLEEGLSLYASAGNGPDEVLSALFWIRGRLAKKDLAPQQAARLFQAEIQLITELLKSPQTDEFLKAGSLLLQHPFLPALIVESVLRTQALDLSLKVLEIGVSLIMRQGKANATGPVVEVAEKLFIHLRALFVQREEAVRIAETLLQCPFPIFKKDIEALLIGLLDASSQPLPELPLLEPTPLGKAIACHMEKSLLDEREDPAESIALFLAHPSLPCHLPESKICRFKGEQLIRRAAKEHPDNSLPHRIRAAEALIAGFREVMHDRDTSDLVADKIICSLASVMTHGRGISAFNDLVFHFIAALDERKDQFAFQMGNFASRHPTPIFICKTAGEGGASLGFRSRFYHYMCGLMTRMLGLELEEELCQSHISNFVSSNLSQLIDSFANEPRGILRVLDSFIFWLKPLRDSGFFVHLNFAESLLSEAISKGIYSECPEKHIEARMYLQAMTVDNDRYPISSQGFILGRLIERLTPMPTPNGVLRSAKIMAGLQGLLLEPSFQRIVKYYEIMAERLRHYPGFNANGKLLLEYVEEAFFDGDAIVLLDGTANSIRAAHAISSRLIRTAFEILGEERFGPNTPYTLISWIGRFMVKTVRAGGFQGKEANLAYFLFADKLYEEAQKHWGTFELSEKMAFSKLMLKSLSGLDDPKTLLGKSFKKCAGQLYAKALKEKRSLLIANWISFLLADEHEDIKASAAALYQEARDATLFSGKPALALCKKIERSLK